MQLPIRSVWRSHPLLLALGLAALVVAYFFSIPEPGQDWVAVATPAPEKPARSEPPAAPAVNAEEPAANEAAVVLPQAMRELVDRVRKQGKNPWWADAVETAWARGFPAAVEVLRASVPPEQLDEKVRNFLSMIAQERLEFLLEGLPFIRGESPSTTASGPISAWADKDPMRLVGYAREHFDGAMKMSALSRAFNKLIERSQFSEATTVLNTLPQSETRRRMVESMAAQWGRSDFDGAIAWARAFSSDADQIEMERSVIRRSIANFPLERVREFAARYATKQTQSIWDSALGGKILDTDVEAAIAWSNTLSDESRRSLQRKIAPKLAQTDVARGTAYALRIDDESGRVHATDDIHQQLAQKSMQAVIDWTWTLPEELQHRSVVSIVTDWYRTDEEATKAWVASLPPNRVRDRAAMWLAWQVGRSDPVAAGKIADGINDPQFKEWAFKYMERKAQQGSVDPP